MVITKDRENGGLAFKFGPITVKELHQKDADGTMRTLIKVFEGDRELYSGELEGGFEEDD